MSAFVFVQKCEGQSHFDWRGVKEEVGEGRLVRRCVLEMEEGRVGDGAGMTPSYTSRG